MCDHTDVYVDVYHVSRSMVSSTVNDPMTVTPLPENLGPYVKVKCKWCPVSYSWWYQETPDGLVISPGYSRKPPQWAIHTVNFLRDQGGFVQT